MLEIELHKLKWISLELHSKRGEFHTYIRYQSIYSLLCETSLFNSLSHSKFQQALILPKETIVKSCKSCVRTPPYMTIDKRIVKCFQQTLLEGARGIKPDFAIDIDETLVDL